MTQWLRALPKGLVRFPVICNSSPGGSDAFWLLPTPDINVVHKHVHTFLKNVSMCLPTCMLVCTQCGHQVLAEADVEIRDSCESPCRCWKLYQCPLDEQQGLLTTEPSLQLLTYIVFKESFVVQAVGEVEAGRS